MTMAQKHIDLLGHKAVDAVTGLKGVVTSISFDLYGCVQALVTPPAADKNNTDATWLDVGRLKISRGKRVLPIPAFNVAGPVADGEKGPAEKPVK